MQQTEIWAVIPAAGIGKRMQADRPKQYLSLLGKTVIEHTLDCFLQHPRITGLVIALHPNDPYWQALSIRSDTPIHTVIGGKERSDSVLNALNYLSEELNCAANSWVMVHDAARPCLSAHDIDQLVQLVEEDDPLGGILASPVKDTMKRAKPNLSATTKTLPIQIAKTESRDHLYHALTPQIFRLQALQQAVQFAFENNIAITDDASAMEQQQLSPRLIMGNANNIKITQASDLALAEFFLSQRGQSL
jgi:2-C-methyl-D-erythritol 4-phosphate cytidylyltransferase